MLKKLIPNKLARITLWLTLLVPTFAFLVVSICYFIYLFWPRDFSQITEFLIPEESQHLTIIAHGVKDSPLNWGVPLKKVIDSKASNGQHVVNIDWRPYSDNPLICSVVAKKIGHLIAERVASKTNLKSIHAIGHSCGAFIVLGISQSIRENHGRIKVQSTYLDPVSIYAGIFWDYGVEYFGRYADYSDAYIDTEDGVPGSNRALTHSISFDVTSSKHIKNVDYTPHNWPPHFYIDALAKNNVPLLASNENLNAQTIKGVLLHPKAKKLLDEANTNQ